MVEKDLVRPDDPEQLDQTLSKDSEEDINGKDNNDQSKVASSDLLPLAQPKARNNERTAARFKLLDEAKPVFTQGRGLRDVGTLLILPALEETGLIKVAKHLYKRMSNGFYRLSSILLMLVFLSIVRESRVDGGTRILATR